MGGGGVEDRAMEERATPQQQNTLFPFLFSISSFSILSTSAASPMTISNFFVLSQRGDVILAKEYRYDGM